MAPTEVLAVNALCWLAERYRVVVAHGMCWPPDDPNVTPFDPPLDLKCPHCHAPLTGVVNVPGTGVLVECPGKGVGCACAFYLPLERAEMLAL